MRYEIKFNGRMLRRSAGSTENMSFSSFEAAAREIARAINIGYIDSMQRVDVLAYDGKPGVSTVISIYPHEHREEYPDE